MNAGALLAGFIAGICASLGIGGGGMLILYLTLFARVQQLEAQGINLLFFIPCALVALFLHAKNGLVDKKAALPAVFAGVLGVALGSLLAPLLGEELLRKAFAILLLFLGCYELLAKREEK